MKAVRFRHVVQVLALCAGFGVSMPGAAQALQNIQKRGQINVGYSQDAPPFSFQSTQGTPVGYAIDLCAPIIERIKQQINKPDIRVRYMEIPQDQIVQSVGSRVDLLCGSVSDTPERREKFAFSTPIYISSLKIVVPTASAAKGIKELAGSSVVVIGRTTADQGLKRYVRENNLNLSVSLAVNPQAAWGQMALKHAAGFARDEILLLTQRAQQPKPDDWRLLPESLSREVIAIALPRDADLQRVVDQSLAELVRSGQIDKIYDHWFVQANPGSGKGLRLPLSPDLRAEFDRLR